MLHELDLRPGKVDPRQKGVAGGEFHAARLFVAAEDDTVSIIDTARDALVGQFPVVTPSLLANPRHLKGTGPNGLALARDGRRLFVSLGGWNAVVPDALRQTKLPLPERRAGAPRLRACGERLPRDSEYWSARLGDQDYRAEDRLDTARFNAALWQGRRGETEPRVGARRDLRRHRAALLAAYRARHGCAALSPGERP